jgi:hypothetical protein
MPHCPLFGVAHHQEQLSVILYKALLLHKKDFAYECLETGDIFIDGYTLLRMIYVVVKPNPNIIVDVNLQST